LWPRALFDGSGMQSRFFNVTSLFVLPLILSGCLLSRMQSQGVDSSRFDPAQRFSPTNFEQNATMKDTSVHEDPTLLRVGVSRQQSAARSALPTRPAIRAARFRTCTNSISTAQNSSSQRFTRETSRPASSLAVSQPLSIKSGSTTRRSS